MERLSGKRSENTDLLWSGGLYASPISHFPKRRFISKKRVSIFLKIKLFHRNDFVDIQA